MKSLIIVIGLAAVVALGNAQPFGERGRGEGRGGDFRDMLNLNDETAAKIEKMRDEHQKRQIALRAKLSAARIDFRSLMRSDAPDEKLAMAKQKEMSAIRAEMREARLAHKLAVGKLLTPEQRKLIKERRGAGFARGGAGMGGCTDDERPMKRRDGRRHHRQWRR